MHMETTTGHAFLHKKHRALAPKIATMLRKIKREGLFDRYWEKIKITQAFEY